MVKTPPPENFDKFVLQSKTKSFELHQFQGQQHFNMVTADLLLMHPGWQVGFLLHFGFFSLCRSSLLYSLHSSAHQAGKHGHDHLWLHLHEIFWKSINSGTNSSCHGHSIPIHHGEMRWSALRLLPVNDKFFPIQHNFTYCLLRFKMWNSLITPHPTVLQVFIIFCHFPFPQ